MTKITIWPLETSYDADELISKYTEFQEQSRSILGKNTSIKPHLLSEYFYKLATNEEVLNSVKSIIGPNVNIWSSAFFHKKKNSKTYVGFHSDKPYWQLSSDNVVTAWIALTRSTKSNGCLHLVKENSDIEAGDLDVSNPYISYRNSEKTTEKEDLISFNQKIVGNPSKYALPVELKPGQFSLHGIQVIHGSGPNTSDIDRIGYAVRFIDSETCHLIHKEDRALHVSGNISKYLRLEQKPKGEFTASNIQEHNASTDSAGVFGNKSY